MLLGTTSRINLAARAFKFWLTAMSSTTFSGQMSSLRPSALSQTGVDSEHQDSQPSASSSASLSFLVVCLVMFIILVIGCGVSSRLLTRVRRQTVGASGIQKHITQLIQQTPKMWDVRTAYSQPDSLEAKGQWKYLNVSPLQHFRNSY